MLSSIKLKAALFCLFYFFVQELFATPFRYYLILLTTGESYPYVGSVTINDNWQALAAQLFFPGGHTVVIEMDILRDGTTVEMQINPNGRTFQVAALVGASVSPITQEVRTGAGLPSEWFSRSSTETYQFKLPPILPRHHIPLQKGFRNYFSGVMLRLNKGKEAQIQNIGYSQGGIMLNPGSGTSERTEASWEFMADASLLELIELLVVALMSPQLAKGHHFSTLDKRDRSDEGQRLKFDIKETDHVAREKKSFPLLAGAQGYFLWIQEAAGWTWQYIAGAMPENVPPTGGYGLFVSKDWKKNCYVQPCVNPAGWGIDPTMIHMMGQFSGMNNIGTPPQNCRDGGAGWHNQWDYGGGSGWGGGAGGAGGFSTGLGR